MRAISWETQLKCFLVARKSAYRVPFSCERISRNVVLCEMLSFSARVAMETSPLLLISVYEIYVFPRKMTPYAA